jgi:hypothetical protein
VAVQALRRLDSDANAESAGDPAALDAAQDGDDLSQD